MDQGHLTGLTITPAFYSECRKKQTFHRFQLRKIETQVNSEQLK